MSYRYSFYGLRQLLNSLNNMNCFYIFGYVVLRVTLVLKCYSCGLLSSCLTMVPSIVPLVPSNKRFNGVNNADLFKLFVFQSM